MNHGAPTQAGIVEFHVFHWEFARPFIRHQSKTTQYGVGERKYQYMNDYYPFTLASSLPCFSINFLLQYIYFLR